MERLAIWPGLITPAFTRRFAIPDVATQKAALTGQRAQPLRHHVVIGRTRLWSDEFFELMCSNDLEGMVAKRIADPYDPRVRWLKIKNPDYSQKEGRGDLFNR